MASTRDRRPLLLRPSQRRQHSKVQREQKKQRAIIMAGAIAILFILAVPAYGYWSNFVAPPRSVILQIDGTKYTLGWMAKYMKGLQDLGLNPNLSSEPFRVLQLLEQNQLIRSGAASRGLQATAAEVDQEVRDRVLGRSPELASVPEDQLDREFKEAYKKYLNTINLSEADHRGLAEAFVLKGKLSEALGQDVPSVARQAYVSWIVMSNEPPQDPNVDPQLAVETKQREIDEVERKIQEGEAFPELANRYSDDRTTAVKGGEVGWLPAGVYGPLDETIFSLEPGETSGKVTLGTTSYFIKVTDVDEARTVEPDMKARLKELVLQTWLARERGNHRISVCFGGGSAGSSCDWQYDWLVKRLVEASRQG